MLVDVSTQAATRDSPVAAPSRQSRGLTKERRSARGEDTTHPFFVVYCPVKRASAPSILTQWSFQMLKGGEGEAREEVAGGGGEGGRVGVRNRHTKVEEKTRTREQRRLQLQRGDSWRSRAASRAPHAGSAGAPRTSH